MLLDCLPMYVVKIVVCHAFLRSRLFVFLTYFVFRSLLNGECFFNSASLSLVGDSLLVHKLRVMAAVKLNLNAT